MHVASRSYLAAGVALVGASTIAVSPIAPPAPHVELPAIRASSAAVTLSALTNPLELWAQVIQTSLTNANTVGQQWLADPAPLLRQIIANQLHAAANLPAIAQALVARFGEMDPADPTSVPATIQQFITNQLNGVGTLTDTVKTLLDQLGAMMDPADPYGVPATFQQMLNEIAGGQFAMGFTTFASLGVAIGFPVIMAGFPIAGVISQPFKDLANIIDPTGVASQPLRNIANFIDRIPSVLPGVLINGILGPFNAVGVATAATLEDLMGAVMSADPAGFVSALVNAPAKITDAFLNGYMAPGDFPMAGLIGGPYGISAIGTVLDTLKSLASAIATPGATTLSNQPTLATSTPESVSVVASPLSATTKTTVTLDVAPKADAQVPTATPTSAEPPAAATEPAANQPAATEPAATQPTEASVTEPAATDTKPAADKETAALDHIKVSLKAEPGKTGMGTTKPDEAKPNGGVGTEVSGTVKDNIEGSTTSASGVTSGTASEAAAAANSTTSTSTGSGSGGA